MSRAKKNNVYTARNSFSDRAKEAVENFSALTAKMATLDTALLLLGSKEDEVLTTVFKHITEFVRQQEANVAVVREKQLLDILQEKDFFMESENPIVRRFAMYLATAIVESINVLQELEADQARRILSVCTKVYVKETDDFCLEYLSVAINRCLQDPQAALEMVEREGYLEKFFQVTAGTDNPDVVLHSLEAMHKILQTQSTAALRKAVADPLFPLDRVLCELVNEFLEVRNAALQVTKILITDTGETSPFAERRRAAQVLQQLTKTFCDDARAPNADALVDVLSAALITERMAQVFFEENLFDKIAQNLAAHAEEYPLETKCQIGRIFAEAAKYAQFLARLHGAKVTGQFLECLMQSSPPAAHVLSGLTRLLKNADAANEIVDWLPRGLIPKLISTMLNKEVPLRSREQAADFVAGLLVCAFLATAAHLKAVNFANVLAEIFSQGTQELSVDFVLTLLSIVEQLAQNNEYRESLVESEPLIQHLAILLKNSFSTAIVVANIFRCLCTLIEEDTVRARLICNNISASMKRGLKSLSNAVKIAVTNFVMQTARFAECVHEYVDANVLEVLILHQKHSYCVPTWGPAIEAILAKCPSLKFCIRNQLGFTDSTAGHDFMVSKKRFGDFRVFQDILKEEVSPLHPILVANFERPEPPPQLVVSVPTECLLPEDGSPDHWSYCRNPGDPDLPLLLDALNAQLKVHGLVENPAKVRRCIDFDNMAKRARVVAELVARAMGKDLKPLDLNTSDACSLHAVKCHLHELSGALHCNFIPLGRIRTGCRFERAVLFKCLADQIGLPCTLTRDLDGRVLFNEVPLPLEQEQDVHCDRRTLEFMPWRLLRPTHVVDLVCYPGALYPLQSRQALQYLRNY